MTNSNELQTINNETGEILTNAPREISRTDQYVTMQDSEGKFFRQALYHDYTSFTAESREDKLWLLSVIDGGEDSGFGFKEHVGEKIEIENIITRTYTTLDENTGLEEQGVITYLITPEKTPYVTTSKSVYFTIRNMMEILGRPDEVDWENVTVEIFGKRGAMGQILNVRIVE